MSKRERFQQWLPNPVHGLSVGPDPPRVVQVFVEMTQFDQIKYEVDKQTGYLRVDRPQLTSTLPPTMYGFIPRTHCAERVAALSEEADRGDGDALDISVVSERVVNRGEVLLYANVIGGFCLIDQGQADDKIVGVLQNDTIWCGVQELSELPEAIVQELHHYFENYKRVPGQKMNTYITETYGRQRAFEVIEAAMRDYAEEFPEAGESDGGTDH